MLPTRAVGRLGLRLPAITYGAMGISWGYETAISGAEVATADALLDASLAAGCSAVVTARIYTGAAGAPHNEELVGRALARHGRAALTVITKIGVDLSAKPPFVQSPAQLRAELAASLAALGTDYVDVLVLNRPDPRIPIAETMAVFNEFRAAGKARYFGLSEASAAEIRAAHAVCPLSLIEQEYSLLTRDLEAELLPTVRELGIGVLAYSPLSRGLLAGSLPSGAAGKFDFRAVSPRFAGEALAANLAAAAALAARAAARGCTPAQLCLAWLLAQGDDVVPCPGSTKLQRLAENFGAAEVKLTADEAAELRAAVAEGTGDRYAGMHGTFNSKGAAAH